MPNVLKHTTSLSFCSVQVSASQVSVFLMLWFKVDELVRFLFCFSIETTFSVLECAMLFKFLKTPAFHETGLVSLSFVLKVRKMLYRNYPPTSELLLGGVTVGKF